MTIVLDVSFDENDESEYPKENGRTFDKHDVCSSKVIKVAKVKNKVS